MLNSINRFSRRAALFGVCAFAAVGVSAAVMEDTVANVNGQPILLSEFQNQLNGALDQWRKNVPGFLEQKDALAQLRMRTLDQMIDDKLLEQEAVKRKVKIHDREVDNGITEVRERSFRRDETGKMLSDAEAEALFKKELKKLGLSMDQFRDRIKRQLMVRRLVDEVIRAKVRMPDEGDLRKAYDTIQSIVKGSTASVAGMPEDQAQAFLSFGNRIKSVSSERVRVSHILIKVPAGASLVEKNRAMKRIKEIRAMVAQGGDFAELARKYSEDAESAPRGGDLDFILHGWMPAAFDKTAFLTPVGETSQPVETSFGYHLVRVQEKKASETIGFDKLRDDLGQFIYNLNLQSELEKYVKSLRGLSHIETNLPKIEEASKPK